MPAPSKLPPFIFMLIPMIHPVMFIVMGTRMMVPRTRPSVFRITTFSSTIYIHTFGRVKLRSEEHTSELQSRFDLVCRLLLEKKKKQNINSSYTVISYKRNIH